MWIIIRLLITVALLTVVEIYFIKKLGLAVKNLFPAFHQNQHKIIKRIFFIWMNIYPIVLIAVFVYFAITSEYITQPSNWIIDYLVIYPFWIGFILMVQTAIYFLIVDLIKLIAYPLIKKHKAVFVKWQTVFILVLISFFTVYIPARVIYDYNEVSVREVEFKKEILPQSLNNFKIAFISDIQADHYTDEGRLENFINIVNSLNPDLVLIAGDLITTGPEHIDLSAEQVGKLKAQHGVYSCIGDHDNWAYRNDTPRSIIEIVEALLKKNVEMVDNGDRYINIDGASIGITFVTNTYVESVQPNILDTLSSSNNGDVKIFLTHQPRPHLIEAARKNDFDLYLAGHTHGGQISFVFPFIQFTPTLFETKYIQGDFRFDDMLMIVTRGLGMSIAPIRYNSTPEVTLIVLNNQK
ncbi:MAG: metallophosphoesterase [Ignavibacteria bacterium]|nr:metallophosphoesterase [Ignavibacteria bacterium]